MESAELKQYLETFLAGRDPGEALYISLGRGIERLLAFAESGAKFPSERELTQLLGINRGTVRKALAPFVESGRLVRHKNDTFVGSAPAAAEGERAPLPAFSPMFGMVPRKELTLLIYERYEFQIEFWKSITDEFNAGNPMLSVHPVVFPGGLQNTDSILAYLNRIRKGECDLVLMPLYYLWPEDTGSFLRPTGDSLAELQSGPDFRSSSLTRLVPGYLKMTVPFECNAHVYYWNRKYLNLGGLEVCRAPFDDILAAAVRELPQETGIVPDYFDLCWDKGVPAEPTPEFILEQCRVLLDRFDLARRKKRCFTNIGEYYLSPLTRKAGNVLCRPEFLLAERFDPALAENFKKSLIRFDRDTCSWTGLSSVAVSRSCRDPRFAELFLEFLLSGDIQDRIWKLRGMIPIRRSSLRTVDFAPQAELDEMLGHIQEAPASTEKALFGADSGDPDCRGLHTAAIPNLIPVGCIMLQYLRGYLSGRISREEIIGHVFRFFRLNKNNPKGVL